jgi:hypothetical protein
LALFGRIDTEGHYPAPISGRAGKLALFVQRPWAPD